MPQLKLVLRFFLIGLLIGNFTIPCSSPLLYSQELLPKDKSVFEEQKETQDQPPSMEKEIEKARFIRYSQERWNQMRERLETGEPLTPEARRALEEPTKKKTTQAPPPVGPGINVVLPYESGLSISGRKVIDFKISSTIYEKTDSGKGRVNKVDFQLDQQLQVRVKGTVGRKVTVNVDYDDTSLDRTISVLYKGDPDEVLQEAAFGDITISLPSTDFVGYSKSVFGARAELMFRPRSRFAQWFPSQLWHRSVMPKQIRSYLIGSRTKGISQTKRFTGQSILQRKELNDIGYQRRQFYLLAFSTGPTPLTEHRPIKVGSEKIFIDDQNPNNNNIHESTRTFKVFESSLTALGGISLSTVSFNGPQGINTGVFKQLIPTVDYTVDYIKGVIRFRREIQLKDIIVVDYSASASSAPVSQNLGGRDPLIANPNEDEQLLGFKPILLKPDETQFFATRELKNYYNFGDTRILRDDGRGNFILKIQDLDRKDPDQIVGLDISTNTQTKSVPKYPDDIEVDFENGIFSFVSSDTFHSPNPKPFTDDIYVFRDTVPNFKNRYRIFAEYRFRKGNFNLERTNIVSLSEQVFVDGKKMTRDVDYFIDYDAGIVTFFRPEQIREDSVVEITFDFSPFGGQGEETVVGMRNEFYMTDNFFLGGSVLYNFAPQPRGIPDLRSVSRSITVLEADMNWKNIKFGNFPIEITKISGEIAQSIKNPNTADRAMLESFEGIKLEDIAILNKDSWVLAANPQKGNPNTTPSGGAYSNGRADALTLSNEDVKIRDINSGAPVETSDKIQALNVDYNFKSNGPSEAMAIAQVLSKSGLDFFTNKKQFLELWVHGDGSNAKLLFRLGGIAELSDSDPSGILKTEDKDKNSTLSTGEDVGWEFLNPDGSTTTIGNGNGRLDTQDLDGNGRLDSDDTYGNYLNEASVTLDFTGWKIFQLPLNIPTTGQLEWSSIKNIRVAIVNSVNAPKSGNFKLGRIAMVGTRFTEASIEPSTAPVSATAFAENNEDNPGYPSLLSNSNFRDLYEIKEDDPKRREQALAIQYQRTANTAFVSTVTTKETFTRSLDFSEHETLKFFLYGDSSGSDFFFRIGTPGNFFEYKTALTFSGWRLIELDILDKNRDGQLDNNAEKSFGKWQRRVGAPSLRNITEITMGVIIPAGGPDPSANKIYINEMHLTGSVKIKGVAYRANSDFAWKGWGSWGANWRFVDRNFQTLTSAGSGQDTKGGSAYLNFTRLKFIPLSSNMTYAETVTPQISSLNDPNILVSVIDEGKTINTNQNLSGNFLMTQLPWIPNMIKNNLFNVGFSADHSLAFRSAGDREDETFNYRYGTSYSLPWQPDLLPTRFLTFKPLPGNLSYNFSQTNSFQRITLENTDTRSVGENYGLGTSFQFFPQLNLTPNYSYSQTFEERKALDPNKTLTDKIKESLGKYNKTQNQAASLSGSLQIISWLTPGFSYSINTAETYNVNNVQFGTTTFKRGELKNISRTSGADISASVAPKNIFQYIRYVRALNPMINSLNFSGGYSISDADTYDNVNAGFFARDKLLIRGRLLDLSGQNPNARRTNLTATDSSRVSGRWTPFEGFTFLKSRLWAPIKNINTSGTFTESKTRRDTTGTESFTYSRVWPDMILSTYEVERPLFLIRRWMRDARLNANYQERLNEVRDQTRSIGFNFGTDLTFTLFKLLQFSVGYTNSVSEDKNLVTNQVTGRTKSKGINGQVITTLKWGNWRFTPRYDQSQKEAEDGKGKKTEDLITRNGSLQIFGDINVPRFFKLPLGKQLTLSNRLIVTSSIRYGMIRNGVDETQSKDNLDSNLNGDLEITPNIRVGFGGTYARTFFKTKKEENFSTFGFNTRITIQF
ncbi:MAG: hypothetical protein A3I11_08685 [Elusimicrobia bacterium RIFCSPLOWO2_02_FULL_39_32]|nr:MAG: hypothetical protein A3B80_03575 [Elusimicrobia bacterium RIFCSPHIGHO2_02_FULL_39_36]OGR93082.1 MAG: hypothetical protein A3I11_08685 [Elusimicrobia bacterium RIFCSPLOWO2_02_FULL_39_32]OGS00365.1 MAG: hypothetical protein A3G85_00080 [Elusimicrobia bacterium RIFCSPLOWO2_12_FULL_39_28]